MGEMYPPTAADYAMAAAQGAAGQARAAAEQAQANDKTLATLEKQNRQLKAFCQSLLLNMRGVLLPVEYCNDWWLQLEHAIPPKPATELPRLCQHPASFVCSDCVPPSNTRLTNE